MAWCSVWWKFSCKERWEKSVFFLCFSSGAKKARNKRHTGSVFLQFFNFCPHTEHSFYQPSLSFVSELIIPFFHDILAYPHMCFLSLLDPWSVTWCKVCGTNRDQMCAGKQQIWSNGWCPGITAQLHVLHEFLRVWMVYRYRCCVLFPLTCYRIDMHQEEVKEESVTHTFTFWGRGNEKSGRVGTMTWVQKWSAFTSTWIKTFLCPNCQTIFLFKALKEAKYLS